MFKSRQKLILGILAYALMIALQLIILRIFELPRFAKTILALLPMVPAIWFTSALLQVVSKMDELKKKIILESAAFSLIATTLITLSYGFIEGVVGLPKISMVWVWPLIATNLIIAKLFTNRRYR